MAGQQVTLTISAEDSASGILTKVASGLDSLGKKAEETGRKIADSQKESAPTFQKLQQALENTSRGFQNALSPATLFGSFLGVVLVRSFHQAAAEVMNYVQGLKQLSLVTDSSTEELAALQLAAGDVGVETGSLQRAFFLLSNEIETGGSGLAKLGVQVRSSSGHMKSQVQILGEVSTKLQGMTDKTQALNAVRDLFGRQGLQMMPLLMDFHKRMAEGTIDAEKLGLAISEKTVKALREYKVALGDVDDAMTGMKLQVFLDLFVILDPLAKGMKTVAEAFASIGSSEVGKALRQTVVIIGTLSAAILAVIIAFGTLKALLVSLGIGALITAITAALAPFAFVIGEVIVAGSALALMWGRLKAEMQAIFDWFRGGVLEQAYAALSGFLSRQMNRIDDFVRWIRGKPSQIQDAMRSAFENLESDLVQGTPEPIKPGELQKQIQVIQQLTQAQIQLAQATMSPAEGQEFAAKKQAEMQELQLVNSVKSNALRVADLEKSEQQIEEIAQKAMQQHITFEDLKVAATKAAAANIQKIRLQEAEQDLQKFKQLESAKINLTSAGEEQIRRQADLERRIAKVSFDNQITHGQDLVEAEKNKNHAIELSNISLATKLRDINSQRFEQSQNLVKKDIEIQQGAVDFEKDLMIRALQETSTARQQAFDDHKISQQQLTSELLQFEEEIRDAKLSAIHDAEIAAKNSAGIDIAIQSQKVQGNKERSLAIEGIEKDLAGKLQALDQQKITTEKDYQAKKTEIVRNESALRTQIEIAAGNKDLQRMLEDLDKQAAAASGNVNLLKEIDSRRYGLHEQARNKDIKREIDAWAEKTHIIEDETSKQLAIEASKYEFIERHRTEDLRNAATVAEQHARLAGDTGAAFATGFAEASASAGDAFKEMRQAGQETYQALKSGLSDFVYDTITGAKNIGDIFANLGKRILRSFSDAFASVIAKQAAMAFAPNIFDLVKGGSSSLSNLQFESSDSPISNIFKLGSASSETAGDLDFFGRIIGIATKLLGVFGQGLSMFSGGITKLLGMLGVPGGAEGLAGILGNAAGGGIMGFGISQLFGGGTATQIGGTIGGIAGSFFPFPGGSLLGSIIGSAVGKINEMLWGGNRAAEIGGTIGTFLVPGIGTLLGGFIGGLFGSTPKGKLSASITPFDRRNIGEDILTEGVVGTQVGAAIVNLGGNVLSSKKEIKLQERIAKMLNELFTRMVDSVVRLIDILPDALGAQLDTALTALEESGIEIVDKKWKGAKAGKKLKKRIKGLADEAVQDIIEALGFGDVDLKALGGGKRGDAGKGFDAMIQALSVMSTLLEESGHSMDAYNGTLADFTKSTIDYFKQFQQEGEEFTDTVKRVGEALLSIVSMTKEIDSVVASLSDDLSVVTANFKSLIEDANEQITKTADALTIAIESDANPEEVAQAAQTAIKAVTDAYELQIGIATQLYEALLAIGEQLNNAIDLYATLTNQIQTLAGETEEFSEQADRAVILWRELTTVGQRIQLFGTYAKLWAADVETFQQALPLLTEGFNAILEQIHNLSSASEAVESLKALASETTAAFDVLRQSTAAHYATERRSAQTASDERIAALESQREAIQDISAERVQALSEEADAIREVTTARLDALQEELSLAQDWQRINASIKQQLAAIFDLMAPTQPVTNLEILRGQFQEAFTAFQSSPSTAQAELIQTLGQRLLQSAQQVPGYDLPSTVFRDLVAEVQGVLQFIGTVSESSRSSEEIEASIEAIEQEQSELLAGIDLQIASLQESQADQLRAIDLSIQAERDSLTQTLKDISTQEQAAMERIDELERQALEAIRVELALQIDRLREEQKAAADALREIIGDKTYEQFIASKQAEAVVMLQSIQALLKEYLAAIFNSTFSDPVTTSPQEQTVSQILKDAGFSKKQREEMTLITAQGYTGFSAQWWTDLLFPLGFQMHTTLKEFFKKTFNTNQYDYTISQIEDRLKEMVDAIPAMASGGIVMPRPGGTLVRLAEAGEPEIVSPFRLGSSAGGDTQIIFSPQITITGTTNARKMADELEDALVEKMQTGSRLRQATKALMERRS